MPKQIHIRFLFVLLLAVPLLFSSCIRKKLKENKLVGTWAVIKHSSAATETEQWVFSGDGLLTVNLIHDSTATTREINAGDWTVMQKVSKAYLNVVFELERSGHYGFYEISKIKKDALVLSVQDGGQYLMEFEKVE